MTELSGIGKAYRTKLSRVLERHGRIITPKIVAEVLGVSTQESGRLLARWCNSGWVYRAKRGVYLPVPLPSTSTTPVVEEPFLLAESIYGPGYIGGFSAVKYWDLSEQIIETVTYFTRKKVKDRHPVHAGVTFRLKTVPEHKVFGLKTVWVGSKRVYVSDPTKTIIDLLDDPRLVGGMAIVNDILAEYLDSEHYDFECLMSYIEKIRNKTVYKRLGFLLNTSFPANEDQLSLLRSRISKGYSDFDPSTASTCTVPEWRLKTSQSWKDLHDRKK
jgi:predicted transcriptional regulator of viral defense system